MILYLDCTNGVSGDMLAASLLELVAQEADEDPLEDLVRPALAAAGLDPSLVSSEEVRRGGVAARAFTVAEAEGFATFAELIAAVEAAALPPRVSDAVVATARRMAAAEARVHGSTEEHLHELADADTAIDLISVAMLVERLSPASILASPPALGSGVVRTAHGLVAVPAPAVLELLKGRQTAGNQDDDMPLGELTTPTGAALLAHYAATAPGIPPGRIERVGYGAGQREIPGRPNVLRAVLLNVETLRGADDLASPEEEPRVVLLETSIDDMTPELLAHAAERLRAAGAIDVWLTAATMKKGRPGIVMHLLAGETDRERLADVVFAETSSFGLRVLPVSRLYANERRDHVSVDGHVIAVRLATADGRLITASPEYEDVRRAAAALGRPARVVYEAAQAAARAGFSLA